MTDPNDLAAIDAVIERFFAAFDNRDDRTVRLHDMTECFAARAVIATHHAGQCEIHTSVEFAEPRVALLGSGALKDFHEWEESSTTQVAGSVAARSSRYAKAGLHNGVAYAGTGTKFFQLARFGPAWRIVALTWIDDEP